MDTIYFISDVHLGGHDKEIEEVIIRRLIAFLKSITGKADYLYIVGDLYDFWFEYYKSIPKVNLKVLAGLNEVIEAGTKVGYFTGNHDVWHDSYFEEELGLQIYHAPLEIYHNQLKLFIAHGDGLAKGEWKIRFIKRVLNNPLNIFLYKILHPDLGIMLASRFSNGRAAPKPNPFHEQYKQLAREKLRQGFDAVVLGHTHMPVFEEYDKNKFYINLGDWVEHFTYLKLTNKKFEFLKWQD